MTILSVSGLSRRELAFLGNNVPVAARRDHRAMSRRSAEVPDNTKDQTTPPSPSISSLSFTRRNAS